VRNPRRARIPRTAVVVAALLLLGAAPAWGTGLQTFLLASSPDSFADLQAHAAAIGVVYPTYYECQPGSGSIEGHDEPAIDAYAAAHRIPLLPRFNCQDGPTVELILTEPALRARTLAGLYALAANPAYAGLSLDLENAGAEDRAALSSFVAELARHLHALHRRLAVVVDGVPREEPRRQTYLYDDRALSAAADSVFVLGWGVHWEGSAPGPIAPLPWVRQVVAHLASLPYARRFVLGTPMYGLDWGASQRGVAHQYSDIAALAGAAGAKPLRDRSADELTFAYQRNGIAHRVWYLDARAVLDRFKLARAHGLAVGVWRLGREDQALWASPFVG